MDPRERIRICGRRYEERRADGKAGWADEASYAQKTGRLDAILAGYPVPHPCRFLELGCGNGNVTLHMAARGHAAYGVDLVPEAISWAREQAAEQNLPAEFSVGSVATLAGFADRFFDLVFDANCLIMVLGKEREAAVSSVWRVLKPGGLFYAEAHLVNEAITERTVFSGKDWLDPEGQFWTVEGHPMYYLSREEEFVRLVEGAGFRILQRVNEPLCPENQDLPFCAGGMWVVAVKME